MFKSRLISPEAVIKDKLFFNIPIYQRLYVWGRGQVLTLLGDLWQACQEEKDTFYLGGTLVIERKDNEGNPSFDLIDGQQRFTTLWLLSIAWQESLKDFSFIDRDNDTKKHRIEFAIRPEVKKYFDLVLNGHTAEIPQARQLADALSEIKSFKINYLTSPDDLKKLTLFIKEKVQLILTTVPEKTDLNKLFEVINNRGIQLQHHEILKARLLDKLDSSEREGYNKLWEACSYMNDYVERNLRSATGLDVLGLYKKNSENKLENLADAQMVLLNFQDQYSVQDTWSLSTILTPNEVCIDVLDKNRSSDNDDYSDRVESIISFSMLLQHTLRIYLSKKHLPDIRKVADKDLLKIFNDSWLTQDPSSDDVKIFIELLWKVRYLFDKHVIKWVLVDEDKFHGIRALRENNGYLQRETNDSRFEFSLLQSMLYHSQEMVTQYWLTPLLNYLVLNGEEGCEQYLEYLDNHLLCSLSSLPLIERTRLFLDRPWHKEPMLSAQEAFNKTFDNGTQYPHYWFYKLEYVLYKALERDTKRKGWRDNFRMTAKNSVEHISPQSLNRVSNMHTFGNLALVTRSLNSELSDKSFGEKRAYFLDKHQGKGVSLKLEYVYENERWSDNEILEHQDHMIQIFDEYLGKTKIINIVN